MVYGLKSNQLMLEKIRTRLAAMPDNDAVSYATHMWRHTLDCLETGREDASGALPYLPAAPEALGIALSENDRVLDVGCLGGHGLFDLAWRRQQAGMPLPQMTGMDIEYWLPVRELCGDAFDFVAGSAEALPFADGTFRVVIARLLLPYVRIESALAELHRVTAGDGLMYLQAHGPGYYRRKLLRSLRNPRTALYYLRPLISGVMLQLTGRQRAAPRWRETALSAGMLERLAVRHGLRVVWRGADADRPLVVLRRG